MKFELISNFNFNTIKDYAGPAPKDCGRNYGYRRIENKLEFYTNFVTCPCIYYIKKDNLFAYSFDPDLVVNFAKENNIELTNNFENINKINNNLKKHIKSSIRSHYKYNLNYIENWKKVTVSEDGFFIKEENTFKPFTLDIIDGYEQFKKFITKYKKLVDKYIDTKEFIPTMTGGLDTRALSGLYKNRASELDYYFQSSVKQDGKNNVEQGNFELEVAKIIIKKLGIGLTRLEELPEDKISITGMFNENAIEYENSNDPDYIYKIIQHAYDNKHQFANKLVPYIDEDYLVFKQDLELFRMLMMIILAQDLMLIRFTSGTSLFNHFPNGSYILPDMQYHVDKAFNIINNWGKDNIDNILSILK